MSVTGSETIGERDQRDVEREDPSVAGKPEIPAEGDEDIPAPDAPRVGRLEEREEPQQDVQQHQHTFVVESDQPTDASGVERGSASTSAAEMVIAGIEVPATAVGELALRLYRAGNVGLALQFSQTPGYHLDLNAEDRQAILRVLGEGPPAGLEELRHALLADHSSGQRQELV